MEIELPISKSIANRLLILQAMHGDPLMEVSCAKDAADVVLLRDALAALQSATPPESLDLANDGTAMRFLTAYCALWHTSPVMLAGSERMAQRPIGPLVDALRSLGCTITYLENEGFPPLSIVPRKVPCSELSAVTLLAPQASSQFVSALLLAGVEVKTDDASPYIYMTRVLRARYPRVEVERDWSAAAFWYEYVALHGGEIFFPGLAHSDLQGDEQVVRIFASLGVTTEFAPQGVRIRRGEVQHIAVLTQDFASCPDLYPAVALTCEKLGIPLHASGVERLQWKESDRLEAVAMHQVRADHRMAMALLVAGYPVDDYDCIAKSYPQFYVQFLNAKCSVRP